MLSYIYFKLNISETDEISSSSDLITDDWRACTSWEYDTSFWRKTIIMDFDLVCDVRPGTVITPHI